ncbi:hypothetical protein Cgig2_009673 [Carnegiea gigantea]|uniref:Uncharacterized protein n=1 Tax=Carnegiea gigantea TaxID=171969 RepID=A0A9Q1GHF0_9CARY|nr:hypothetical protein Cgig2_009673 [Carnegiea gigantea]
MSVRIPGIIFLCGGEDEFLNYGIPLTMKVFQKYPSQVNNQLLSTQLASQARTDKNHCRRQTGGSAMLGAQIKHMVASCRIMSQEGPNRMNKQASSMSTIVMAMQIINHSDFSCYAIHVLEDAMKSPIFLNMDDDDDSRLNVRSSFFSSISILPEASAELFFNAAPAIFLAETVLLFCSTVLFTEFASIFLATTCTSLSMAETDGTELTLANTVIPS